MNRIRSVMVSAYFLLRERRETGSLSLNTADVNRPAVRLSLAPAGSAISAIQVRLGSLLLIRASGIRTVLGGGSGEEIKETVRGITHLALGCSLFTRKWATRRARTTLAAGFSTSRAKSLKSSNRRTLLNCPCQGQIHWTIACRIWRAGQYGQTAFAGIDTIAKELNRIGDVQELSGRIGRDPASGCSCGKRRAGDVGNLSRRVFDCIGVNCAVVAGHVHIAPRHIGGDGPGGCAPGKFGS